MEISEEFLFISWTVKKISLNAYVFCDALPKNMCLEQNHVIIETENLTKKFGDIIACKNISLKFFQNEILGVIGPNGAGKTTLLSMISGELAPSSGKIKILGMDVLKYRNAIKPMLGVMPQEYGLYGHLTVEQHINLFGRLSGLSRSMAKNRTKEIIGLLGLSEHSDRKIEQLSAGWKQRVLLAMSLVHKPKIALLDEPTSKLDPLAKRKTWKYIELLKEMEVSIILTSHDMQEVETLSDYIIFINNGCVIAEGRAKDLKNQIGAKFSVLLRYRASHLVPQKLVLFLSSSERVHNLQISLHEIRFLTSTELPRRFYDKILAMSGNAIEEFTLSIPSIEEVFLTLADEKD